MTTVHDEVCGGGGREKSYTSVRILAQEQGEKQEKASAASAEAKSSTTFRVREMSGELRPGLLPVHKRRREFHDHHGWSGKGRVILV